MDDADEVLFDVKDRVAVLTLNRPEKLNALSRSMQERYFRLLADCDADDGVRAVVVTGAGRSFCSGGDFGSIAGRLEPGTRGSLSGPRYLRALTVRKPVVAAVNGHCVGIGLLLACACDMRFAGRDAVFSAVFPRRGLSAEEAISWFLPRLVGLGNAMDILLSGRRIDGAEAKAMGLVNRVAEGDPFEAAMDYARDLAAHCSPSSMATIKRAVYRHAAMPVGEALAETRLLMTDSFNSPDPKEGFAAFREKRAPDFPPLGEGSNRLTVPLPDA